MASTTPYRDLPSDLFPDILSRLPVKSLLRFRCVSKPWLALVDDDADFARLHLNNFKNNSDEPHLFVVKRSKECVLMCSHTFEFVSEIPTSFPSRDWSVVSSLHGVILLESFKSGEFADLMVWNPSIRKLLQIPPLVAPEVSSSTPFREKNILGYDQVSNTYKIVKLLFEENFALHSGAIYEFGADSWKIIKEIWDWHWYVYLFDKAVYFRGSLYFIARDLVRFDLSKEVFSSVSIPNGKGRTLVLMDGRLSVVGIDTDSSEIYTLVLDIESKSWTKIQLYYCEYADFFHIKKNGDMLTWRSRRDRILGMWSEVKSYNRGIEESKILQPCDFHVSHVSCYVESLILHK